MQRRPERAQDHHDTELIARLIHIRFVRRPYSYRNNANKGKYAKPHHPAGENPGSPLFDQAGAYIISEGLPDSYTCTVKT